MISINKETQVKQGLESSLPSTPSISQNIPEEISAMGLQIEKNFEEEGQIDEYLLNSFINKLIECDIDLKDIRMNQKFIDVINPIYTSTIKYVEAMRISKTKMGTFLNPIVLNSSLEMNNLNDNFNNNINDLKSNTSDCNILKKKVKKVVSSMNTGTNRLKDQDMQIPTSTSTNKNIDYLMEYKKKLQEKTFMTKIQNSIFVKGNNKEKTKSHIVPKEVTFIYD